jgi:hypothetical protein
VPIDDTKRMELRRLQDRWLSSPVVAAKLAALDDQAKRTAIAWTGYPYTVEDVERCIIPELEWYFRKCVPSA